MLRFLVFVGGFAVLAGVPVRAQTVVSVASPPEGSVGQGNAPTALPTVYFAADELPAFPGGDGAMLRFLSSRLNYPAAALERNVSGKVYIAFVVDGEGRLHDPRVVRGLGFGLDEEALRLVRLMPWWNPGKIQGQPVWVSMTLPIVFRAL